LWNKPHVLVLTFSLFAAMLVEVAIFFTVAVFPHSSHSEIISTVLRSWTRTQNYHIHILTGDNSVKDDLVELEERSQVPITLYGQEKWTTLSYNERNTCEDLIEYSPVNKRSLLHLLKPRSLNETYNMLRYLER